LREEGPFLSGRLVLAVEPLRADWVLAGDMQAVLDSGSFDALPRFISNSSAFFTLAKRWIALGVPVARLALAAVLLMPANNREEGYRRLSSYLPYLRIDPSGSSDLVYQINRRRASSAIQGIEINRLSKWPLASVQSARFHLGPIPSVIPPIQTVGENLTACRLELDINTDPESSAALRPETIEPLVDELIQLAFEISEDGDCP
jgi:hypothetical protein